MRKNFFAILVCCLIAALFLGAIPHADAATVYWRGDSPTINWDGGQGCGEFGSGSSPWWYSEWTPNNARGRPDCHGYHSIRFDNNHQLTTQLNNVGGAWYNANQLIFMSTANQSRTIDGPQGLDMRPDALTTKIENLSTVLHTINAPIALHTTTEINPVNGDLTLTGNIFNNSHWINVWSGNQGEGAGKMLTYSTGSIQGAGGMAIRGDAKFRLTGSGAFTGNIEIDRGELWLGTGGRLSSTPHIYVGHGSFPTVIAKVFIESAGGGISNNITINPGSDATKRVLGGLNTSGVGTFTGAIGLQSYVNLTAANGGTVRFEGVISESVAGRGITKIGAGTVVLAGANTYTGQTSVDAGTLRLGASDRINDGSALYVGAAGTFDLAGFNEEVGNIVATSAGNITTGGGQFRVNQTSDVDFGGIISGSGGSFVKKGTAMLTLSGANTYSGETYIDAGTLRFSVAQGGAHTGQINLGAETGSGAATLSYNAGLTVGNNLNVRSGSSGTKRLHMYAAGGSTLSGAVTLNDDLRVDVTSSGSLTLSGIISGGGTLSKQGSGVLRLAGNNAYTGNTEIDAGELWINNAGSIAGASSIYVGNGATPATGAKLFINNATGGRTLVNTMTINPGNGASENREIGALNTSGINVFSGNIIRPTGADNRALSVFIPTGGQVDFSGVINGDDKVMIRGGGTVRYLNNMTYTGNTELDQGALTIGAGGGINSASTIFVGNGGNSDDVQLNLAANGVNLGSTVRINPSAGSGARTISSSATSGGTEISGALQLSRDVFVNALSGSTLALGALVMNHSGNNDITINNSGNNAVSISGGITAGSTASDLNKLGTGVLTIGGNNSGSNYKLNINQGTVYLTHANALGNGFSDKVNFTANDGTLRVGANVAPASLGMTINGVTGIFNIDAGNTFTVAGVIANGASAGSLRKEGAGTMILNGNNTYTGLTTINSGTLVVNGTISASSGVSVGNNTVLTGRGRVAALSGAGFISPGNSPGIMTSSQFDPTGGLDVGFEFTQLGSPTWNNASASGNDVLRLTHATAPFTASLTLANVIDVYFDRANLFDGDTFRGGFFTDRNSDFTTFVDDAFYRFWVRYDGGGSTVFEGVNYYTLAQYNTLVGQSYNVIRSVVQVPSANFTGGTVNNGWVQQFQIFEQVGVVPEPSVVILMLTGVATIYLRRRRALTNA